jgi:hypothetical protein
MSQDYSEVFLAIKQKLKDYHNATLKNNFDKATDLAIELSDLTIQLEVVTLTHVPKSETA